MLHGAHINPEDRYEATIVHGMVEDKYWFLISYNYILHRCYHFVIITFIKYYSFIISLMLE